jgi:hypothetical protein
VSIILNSINLIRRRIFITENLNAIKCLTSINNIYRDSSDIARTINLLGKDLKTYSKAVKEHYRMYLLKGSDTYERELYRKLLEDNDSIAVEYEEFRIKYGTRKKICTDINIFKRDSQRIIELLEKALGRKTIIAFPTFKYISENSSR